MANDTVLTDQAAWERRPDETPQAYAAFACYRDLGADRSITKVAQESNKNRALIGRWSGRHDWVDRIKAYDAHEEQRWLESLGARRREAAQRQADTAMQLTAKALIALRETDPSELSPIELARFIEVATRIEAKLYPEAADGTRETQIVVFDPVLRYPSQQVASADTATPEGPITTIGVDPRAIPIRAEPGTLLSTVRGSGR